MRAISKGREPRSLVEHRTSRYCNFDNYQEKDELRKALVTEQRGLCCYCMGRIHANPDKMKIEHWRCRDYFPQQQLNYHNLLGACNGGKGQPGHLQHCDTKKGNLDLKWNPAETLHGIEAKIKYDLDGTIRAYDPEFDRQLNEVLNLNLPRLKSSRKSVIDALLLWWRRKKPMSLEKIAQEAQAITGGNRELQPYSQIAVWWLRKKLGS